MEFTYCLPDGGLRTATYFDSLGTIKFDPPIYELRYSTAIRVIEDGIWGEKFKSIVDFGCAEMALFPLLRRCSDLERILEVDIDETLLKTSLHKTEPLISDHLQKRKHPLKVEVYKGSVVDSVDYIKNIEVVLALELIEHLHSDVLDKLPNNVFGFMQPKLAIFSTPNAEFNILFDSLLPNGFRHLDHKFEWTRKEFQSWAFNICELYKNYKVAFIGVGKAPPDHKKIGYVTQFAIFARKDILNEPLFSPIQSFEDDKFDNNQYKQLRTVNYPFNEDSRSKEEKILNEVEYHVNRCKRIDRFYNREKEIYQIPISLILSHIEHLDGTENELLHILSSNNYKVENDFIYCEDDSLCFHEEAGYGESVSDDDNFSDIPNHDVTDDYEENWD
ncbi:small RNA 2'-O-methyltransferase [Teleopsis dalmanni]|uniref:small RNA 2'-O-methyltransferase n=1 Tax=Teleopsis dalmanni TaxID=139649 RepID=UPI0018CE1E9B|nr:small RNA 2'-O-methyltransferase [Teleopsis dalmanni]